MYLPYTAILERPNEEAISGRATTMAARILGSTVNPRTPPVRCIAWLGRTRWKRREEARDDEEGSRERHHTNESPLAPGHSQEEGNEAEANEAEVIVILVSGWENEESKMCRRHGDADYPSSDSESYTGMLPADAHAA